MQQGVSHRRLRRPVSFIVGVVAIVVALALMAVADGNPPRRAGVARGRLPSPAARPVAGVTVPPPQTDRGRVSTTPPTVAVIASPATVLAGSVRLAAPRSRALTPTPVPPPTTPTPTTPPPALPLPTTPPTNGPPPTTPPTPPTTGPPSTTPPTTTPPSTDEPHCDDRSECDDAPGHDRPRHKDAASDERHAHDDRRVRSNEEWFSRGRR